LLTIHSIEAYHKGQLRRDGGGASVNKAAFLIARTTTSNDLLITDEREIRRAWGQFKNSANLAVSLLLTKISRENTATEIIELLLFLLYPSPGKTGSWNVLDLGIASG